MHDITVNLFLAQAVIITLLVYLIDRPLKMTRLGLVRDLFTVFLGYAYFGVWFLLGCYWLSLRR